MEKRQRERVRKQKQQDKERRRVQRTAERQGRDPQEPELKEGGDPDLAGMVSGPQPGQIIDLPPLPRSRTRNLAGRAKSAATDAPATPDPEGLANRKPRTH
ncbi:MAG: hypothetical protein ACREQI_09725 [Candidatus Binataceae bacterium]